jgi:uncharacterized protein involved in response to NO
MGMMARVALGHTGLKLKASNTVTIAFVLINVAAFCRIIMPKWSGIFIYSSMVAWLLAFSLFIFEYWLAQGLMVRKVETPKNRYL